MKPQTIQQGAEAIISLKDNQISKLRTKKSYRIPELDEKIRKSRTKAEAKIIQKLKDIIHVPQIQKVDNENKEIFMEYLDGKKLSEDLENLDYKKICKQIAQAISKLHNQDIIHGDLTTSNMIWVEDKKNNFKRQLSKLKKLNLPKNQYAIFGSGPIVIRGVRDSHDIDIIVKKNLWDKLQKKYKKETHKIEGRKVELIRIGEIEIYRYWLPWIKDINKIIEDLEIIEDFPFAKLKYVIEWKEKCGRKKDKEDIKLIKKYLSSSKHQNLNINNKKSGKLYFIDFGLGFHSKKIEDKAVDLHLLKQALEAKHFKISEQAIKIILENYKAERYKEILERINVVEKRGRYRH